MTSWWVSWWTHWLTDWPAAWWTDFPDSLTENVKWYRSKIPWGGLTDFLPFHLQRSEIKRWINPTGNTKNLIIDNKIWANYYIRFFGSVSPPSRVQGQYSAIKDDERFHILYLKCVKNGEKIGHKKWFLIDIEHSKHPWKTKNTS